MSSSDLTATYRRKKHSRLLLQDVLSNLMSGGHEQDRGRKRTMSVTWMLKEVKDERLRTVRTRLLVIFIENPRTNELIHARQRRHLACRDHVRMEAPHQRMC